MAVKFKRQYLNQAEQIYDLARTNELFDQNYYDLLAAENRGEDYTYAIAGTSRRKPADFNKMDYDLLTGEDKFQYLYNEFYADSSSDEYKKNRKYFNDKINAAKDAEIYASLSSFEKFMGGVASIAGNAMNDLLLGTIEGLIDTATLITGGISAAFGGNFDKYKRYIAEDTTGYSKVRDDLFRYTRAYSDVDKKAFLKGVNAVANGLVKLTPLLIPGVGQGVYFGSMVGNTTEEAVRVNPDISAFKLFLYAGGTLLTELATEKISSIFFKGSAIDTLIFGKGHGGSTPTHWWSRMGMDFLSEGLEESVSEFADSVLFKQLVDPSADISSMSDILYAGLIGGLIGGVSTGISIGNTHKMTLNGVELSKTQSLAVRENLAGAMDILNNSEVAKLQTKYSKDDLDTIKKDHKDEYEKAVKIDEKRENRLNEVLGKLSKVLNTIGPEQFSKALDIANQTYDKKFELLQNYTNQATGVSAVNRRVEEAFAKRNPGSSITVNENLTTHQRNFKDGIKRAYGKDVYFVTFGEENGDIKHYGATLDENTIIIDNAYSNKVSSEVLAGEIIREELAHTLQYNSGILSAKTVSELLKMYSQNTNKDLKGAKLGKEYAKDSDLTKISESQAKALSETLLFDELSINELFAQKVSVFKKIYRWIKNQINTRKKKNDDMSKLQYKELLLAKKQYDTAIANRIGNGETLDKILELDSEDITRIEKMMAPDYSNSNFIILAADHSENVANKIAADQELSKNRVITDIENEFDYSRVYDVTYYNSDFVELVMSINPEDTFENNLQEHLMNNYGFHINQTEECLMEVIDLNAVLSSEGLSFLNDPNSDVKTMSDLFTNEFKAQFNKYNTGEESLENTNISVVETDDTPYIEYIPRTGMINPEFVIHKNPNETERLKSMLSREFSRFLTNQQGEFNSVTKQYVKGALLKGPRKTLDVLAQKTLTKKFYNEHKNDPEALAENVSYAVYRITEGRFGDDMKKGNLKKSLDVDVDGFLYNDDGSLIGYGNLKGINILVPKEFTAKYDKRSLQRETVLTSFNKKENKVGVHYGTLQTEHKSEALNTWGHETGGFGTGTYFMSENSDDKSLAKSRQRNTANLSKYNLFKPKTEKDAILLHDSLRDFNDIVLSETDDVAKMDSLNKLSELLNVPIVKLTDMSVEIAMKYYKYTENDYQKLKNSKNIDTPATALMKQLGYDGVDTMGLKTVDNSKYGTVVYDFKEKDILQKADKKEATVVKNDVVSDSKVDTKPEEKVADKQIKVDLSKPKVNEPKEYKKSVAGIVLDVASETRIDENKIQFNPKNREHNVITNHAIAEIHTALAGRVNAENYEEVRTQLVDSKKPYAPQALAIFDDYCYKMVGTFNSIKVRNTILNRHNEKTSQSAQVLNLQSREVKQRKPATEMVKELKSAGFDVDVNDELVAEFDAKMRDKNKYIDELRNKIATLEKEIQTLTNPADKSEKLQELKDVSDLVMAIESGTAVEVLDWILNHLDDLELASKLRDKIFKKLLSKATKAAEDNKDLKITLKNKNGEYVPYPEFKQKLYKALKKIKSYRMWAMLSSPVTWVKNWIGNTLMKGLDYVTNTVERGINKHLKTEDGQVKFNETKAGKDVAKHIGESHESYIKHVLILGEDKYDTTAEKAAEHASEIRAKQYEISNSTFEKLWLKAQDLTHWGLSAGPLGDEPMLFNAITKNMGNLIASNIDMCLIGIKNEADILRRKQNLTDAERTKLAQLDEAIQSRDPIKIFDLMSSNDTTFFFDIAKELAFQQYFRNTNAFSKWMANVADKHPIAGELMSWVLPFPKVAVNILSMAYRYSPLGFIKALSEQSIFKHKQADGKLEGIERGKITRAFAEASVGTFMVIAGAIAAALGWVDIDDDDYMGPALHFGDTRIGLSNLAPSMTAFSTAAALMWSWKHNKNAVKHTLDTIYDNTLLGTVDNMFKSGSIENFGENAALSYLTQYIPSVLKLVNKGLTGGRMKDKSGNVLEKTAKTLASYIPGVSELVPDKINPYTGESRHSVGSPNWLWNLIGAVSPVDLKINTSNSKLQKEAERIGATTKGFNGMFVINGKQYKLTNKTEYAKYRSNYLNAQFNQIISDSTQVTVEDSDGKRLTTYYSKLNDHQKAQVLKRLFGKSTDLTKIKWWLDNGNYYITGNREEYDNLKKYIGGGMILYRPSWSKSKFVKK